jgi:hypothetical protein
VRLQDQRAASGARSPRATESAEFQARGCAVRHIDELPSRGWSSRRHEILHPIPGGRGCVREPGDLGRDVAAAAVSGRASVDTPGVSLVEELTHAALAYLGVFPEEAVDAY